MSNSEHLSLFRSYLPCPNSELFIVCFVGFLICQGGICPNFIIFSNRLTNRFDWFIRAIRIQHCFFVLVILVSTPPCFVHISLIRTWNGAPFFFGGLLILQGIFYQSFIIFLNRMDWLATGSTG